MHKSAYCFPPGNHFSKNLTVTITEKFINMSVLTVIFATLEVAARYSVRIPPRSAGEFTLMTREFVHAAGAFTTGRGIQLRAADGGILPEGAEEFKQRGREGGLRNSAMVTWEFRPQARS